MGTTCTLVAVVPAAQRPRATEALDRAEATLRRVEALMSVWLADSEISHLNSTLAHREVPLSPDTRHLLRAAQHAAAATGGAFDVTIQPLIQLWRSAGERGLLPTQADIDRARSASNWDMIELTDVGAVTHGEGFSADLGGIAKGYAIDRALEDLQSSGAAGGIVDVGGDLSCFGRPPIGEEWLVDIESPFPETDLGELRIPSGAVCTSGNYARFTTIEGTRYSHIIDPRSGRPADAVPSVTVVAPEATTADIWATALSVLGPDGIFVLPREAEALIVLGPQPDRRTICTPGFLEFLQDPPDALTVWESDQPSHQPG